MIAWKLVSLLACAAPAAHDRAISNAEGGKTDASDASFAVWLTAMRDGEFGCMAEIATTGRHTKTVSPHQLGYQRDRVIEALRDPKVWLETAFFPGPPAVGELTTLINVTGKAPFDVYRILADVVVNPTTATFDGHRSPIRSPHKLFDYVVAKGGRWISNHRGVAALVAISVLAPQIFGISRVAAGASALTGLGEAELASVGASVAALAPRVRTMVALSALARRDGKAALLERLAEQFRALPTIEEPRPRMHLVRAFPTGSAPGHTFERSSPVGQALEHILFGTERTDGPKSDYLTLLLRGFTHEQQKSRGFRHWPRGDERFQVLWELDEPTTGLTQGSDVVLGVLNRLPEQSTAHSGEPASGLLTLTGPQLTSLSPAPSPTHLPTGGLQLGPGEAGLFHIPGALDRSNTVWIQRGTSDELPQDIDSHRSKSLHWIPIGPARADIEPAEISDGGLESVCDPTAGVGLPGATMFSESMLREHYSRFDHANRLMMNLRGVGGGPWQALFDNVPEEQEALTIEADETIPSSELFRWNLALLNHFGADVGDLVRHAKPRSKARDWLSTARRFSFAWGFLVEDSVASIPTRTYPTLEARPNRIGIQDADLVILTLGRLNGSASFYVQGTHRSTTVSNAMTVGGPVRLGAEGVQSVVLRARPGDELHVTHQQVLKHRPGPILEFVDSSVLTLPESDDAE